MKKHSIIQRLLPAAVFLIFTAQVQAAYVLPYPSYMPGNKLYTVSRIFDRLREFWYFGDIAKFRYHLSLADKYLVEAKTLFEYNQYLLGSAALERSNLQFSDTIPYILSSKRNGKDIKTLTQTVIEAAGLHGTVLSRLIADTPSTFTWTPEKAGSTVIPIHELLSNAMQVRRTIASEAATL